MPSSVVRKSWLAEIQICDPLDISFDGPNKWAGQGLLIRDIMERTGLSKASVYRALGGDR